MERPETTPVDTLRRWGAEARRRAGPAARKLLPLAAGFLAAFLVFNYVVMPRFVRHGEELKVPDVSGRSLAQATDLLAQARLAVRDTVARTSPSVPRGTVLDQDPRAGSHIKPGRGVELVVSEGKRSQKLPALTGQTLRFARMGLSQDGYRLGDVLRVPSSGVARNFVIASDPAPGEQAGPGERVDLLVSDGPPSRRWVMPDLRGLEVQLTADRLRFAGFTVVVEGADPYSFSSRRIVRTDPPAGAAVDRTDTVRLVGG